MILFGVGMGQDVQMIVIPPMSVLTAEEFVVEFFRPGFA